MREYIKIEIFNGSKYNMFKLFKIILVNLNVRFIFYIRLSFWLKRNKVPFLSGYFSRKLTTSYGSFIDSYAKIGVGVKFPHPNGIVIGAHTIIGNNCTIFQQVTFGGRVVGDAQKSNYPKVGDNVTIFAGAKLIGNINVGDYVTIGANSVVNKDVPPFSVVAGIPAKIIKRINHKTS